MEGTEWHGVDLRFVVLNASRPEFSGTLSARDPRGVGTGRLVKLGYFNT